MEDKLKTIKEACWKANPSILELKFGCELLFEVEPQFSKGLYCISKNTGHYIVNEDSIEAKILGKYKILGRPIRFSDVFLVIGKNYQHSKLTVNCLGGFRIFDETIKSWVDIALPRWDLSKDNLDDQSPECIAFLTSLLVKNV